MILKITILLLTLIGGGNLQRYNVVSPCCGKPNIANYPQCVQACQQVSPAESELQQLKKLSYIVQKCPNHLLPFWKCVNESFSVVTNVEVWQGRPCCSLAISPRCRTTCNVGREELDITNACRRSDEPELLSCVDTQQRAEKCCRHATEGQCSLACWSVLSSGKIPRRNEKDAIRTHCRRQNPKVISCMEELSRGTPVNNPHESLPCCKEASTKHCRATCRRALTTLATEQEIVDELINACGVIIPTSGMWRCFLSTSDTPKKKKKKNRGIAKSGIDGAKLQCCALATSLKCRKLCIDTYSNGFTTYHGELLRNCYSDPRQVRLATCLDEVDEPCQLGCSGLSYCENFNHRPTELFRSCDALHDNEAKMVVNHWLSGKITIKAPQYLTIPIKNVKVCQPDMWKAIACTLNVKPCHNATLGHKVCRSDCYKVLSQCVDSRRLSVDQTVHGLCDVLTAMVTDDEHCISLSKYLVQSPHISDTSITHPCSPNPCNMSQICIVNRRQCKHCLPYICKEGCAMGEATPFLVPHGALVRVLEPNKRLNCHKVCRCSRHGVLERCRAKTCLKSDRVCIVNDVDGVSQGKIHRHGNVFAGKCNVQCSCMETKTICTKRQCIHENSTIQDRRKFTGLPCSCLHQYKPVCGMNGRTYPSACLAICGGLSDRDFSPGRCEDSNPCRIDSKSSITPCVQGEICVPKRQVCIGGSKRFCRQYECVKKTSLCNRHFHDEVCDTRGEEHTNMCLLLKKRRTFAYWGHCMPTCEKKGLVCGQNGKIYNSECQAWSNRVSVDYKGVCLGVGQLMEKQQEDPVCLSVVCPVIKTPGCVGITPPGACCPMCGAEIRILFSRALADRAVHSVHIPPITVQNITRRLQEHITTPECDVFGYLSIEMEIVMVVRVTTTVPTVAQMEACNTEGHRLAALIKNKHPRIMSDLIFYPFLTSSIRTPVIMPITAESHCEGLLVSVWTVLLSVIINILFKS